MGEHHFETRNKPIRDLMKKVYRKKAWNRTVTTVAGIIVFITTYMLILPAITMTKNPVCGLEEHVHDDNCYTTSYSRVLVCPYEEMGKDQVIVLHHHDENCYDEGGNLICTLSETDPHQHTDQCYAWAGQADDLFLAGGDGQSISTGDSALVAAPETGVSDDQDLFQAGDEAAHSDDSRQQDPQNQTDLFVQGSPEAEAENTSALAGPVDAVFQAGEPALIPQETQSSELLCGKEEYILHTHTEDCYDFWGNLICGKPEVVEHQHTDACFALQEAGRTLTCTLPEHTHTDDCYKQSVFDLLTQQGAQTEQEAALLPDESSDSLLLAESDLFVGGSVPVLEEGAPILEEETPLLQEDSLSEGVLNEGVLNEDIQDQNTSAQNHWNEELLNGNILDENVLSEDTSAQKAEKEDNLDNHGDFSSETGRNPAQGVSFVIEPKAEEETEAPIVIGMETEAETEAPIVIGAEAEEETETPIVIDPKAEAKTEAPIVIGMEAEAETEAPIVIGAEAKLETETPIVIDREAEAETEAPIVIGLEAEKTEADDDSSVVVDVRTDEAVDQKAEDAAAAEAPVEIITEMLAEDYAEFTTETSGDDLAKAAAEAETKMISEPAAETVTVSEQGNRESGTALVSEEASEQTTEYGNDTEDAGEEEILKETAEDNDRASVTEAAVEQITMSLAEAVDEISTDEANEPAVEKETEAETETFAEHKTEAFTEEKSEPTSESVTEAEAASETENELSAEVVTELRTNLDSEQAMEAVTEKTTEPVSEQSTEVVTEETTEPVSEQTTEAVTEKTTEPVSEQTTEAVTEEMTEPVSEQTTEAVTEETTEPVSEQTTEGVTEETTEPVSEQTSEAVTEETTEPVSEQTTEAVTEITTEMSTELVTERETETTTENAPETTTSTASEKMITSVKEYRGTDYLVRVTYDNKAGIPEDAYVDAQEISQDSEEYQQYLAQAKSALGLPDDKELPKEFARFFDIRILVKNGENEEEIEPEGSVRVEILYDEPVNLTGADKAEANVVHFDEKEDDVKVLATVEVTVDQTGADAAVDSEAEESDPITASGHDEEDTKSSEGAEEQESRSEVDQAETNLERVGAKEESSDVFVAGEEDASQEDAYPANNGIGFSTESFSVYGVIYTVDFHWLVDGQDFVFSIPGGGFVSFKNLIQILGIVEKDKADSFIDDVENVSFSSPDLVWVGKVEEDVTIAQLKEKNALGCEYSSDLTEEEIQEINESVVKAVDWALISLKAFDSDEKLTIYMKNGQSWTIRVSDEQTDYRVLVNDSSIGYFTDAGGRDIFARGSNNTYLYVTDVETNNGQVVHYNHISKQLNASVTAVPRENYDFAFWLILNPDGTINTHKSATLSTNNIAIGATHIAFFTPKNSKVIVRGEAEPNTAWHYTPNGIRYVYDRTNLPRYCYTADRLQFQSGIDDSGTRNKYEFIGWYNLDDYLSTGYDVYDNNTGYYKHYFDTSAVTDHTVLIPRYELKEDYRNYYNVWLDASNGVTGANLDNKGTSTFYSRLNRYGAIEGAKTYHYEVQKGNTLYLPSSVANNEQPLGNQSYQVHYNIKGWYDIYSGTYYTPNQNIPITSDTVLYADWFPDNYDIGLPIDTVTSTDTSSFITTHVFDYNNLFNMDSIYLHEDSFVNKVKNYERWDMKTNGLDFVFMSAVSGSGRSLNPAGRTYNNQSHEYGTNGNYYTGVVSPGILNATLQDKLFGITSGQQLGKRYVGKGNFLYTYDDTNGYYYFDSDRNAASYNATADGGRFYLYNYTNKTDKSVGGDNTDFVPFNYGNIYSGTYDGFREAYGEVNYWFGMSSEINFYIPNSTDFRDDSGKTGNRSVKGDEMVYKFAGDDDVWIFVDGELYLDLGGVHGKVYGEINFSNGTITVAQKGALREQTNGIINYKAGDYPYIDGGIEKISYAADQVQTKTFSLAEGDHTLTLYYLERGSSQSNCAIYFNLAPRYILQLNKKDENNSTPLQNAVFEIYTDEACMTPARLWVGSDDTVRGNRFATDANGTLKVNGLVAGHDYFIKEVQPPAGYPNISEEVVKLHIDSEGNATVTSTANDIFEESVTSGQDGPFSISLNLENKKQTSITAKKTWKSLDGKEPDMSIVTDITVQLKRYHLVKESSGTAQKRNVNVHVMYYAFSEYNSTPVASDRGYLTYLQTKTYEAYEGGSISFTATTTNSNAIRGIWTQTNSEHTENYDSYGSAYYYVDYSWYRLPQKVDVTITDIDGDIDYYIMLVSYESKDRVTITLPDSPSSATNPGTGTTTRKVYDNNFTGYTVNLSESNNWQKTWKNLQTGSADNPWYYEVVETGVNGSLPVESPWGVKTFLTTTSSDGLSSGTISVHNTVNALKVKIRKADAEKDEEGEYVDLSGAEFQMYTDTEYEKTPRGEPETFDATPKGFLDTDTLKEDGKTFVSSTDGWIYKGFLPAGTYYFVETKAPEGYTMLVNPIKVQISESGLKYYDFGTGEWKAESVDNDGYYNHYIENTAGAVLPATGGPGTMIYYLTGALMLLSSTVYLLFGKKKTAA